LFQGKKEEAMVYYREYRNQPVGEGDERFFKEAFLADLKELEEAGVVPKAVLEDVEEVRRFLAE